MKILKYVLVPGSIYIIKYFNDSQVIKPHPLQGKHGVLTTGLPSLILEEVESYSFGIYAISVLAWSRGRYWQWLGLSGTFPWLMGSCLCLRGQKPTKIR